MIQKKDATCSGLALCNSVDLQLWRMLPHRVCELRDNPKAATNLTTNCSSPFVVRSTEVTSHLYGVPICRPYDCSHYTHDGRSGQISEEIASRSVSCEKQFLKQYDTSMGCTWTLAVSVDVMRYITYNSIVFDCSYCSHKGWLSSRCVRWVEGRGWQEPSKDGRGEYEFLKGSSNTVQRKCLELSCRFRNSQSPFPKHTYLSASELWINGHSRSYEATIFGCGRKGELEKTQKHIVCHQLKWI